MIGVTSNSIANIAIGMIGDNQPTIIGNAPNFDDSTAGIALAALYGPAVQAVARRWGYDFARNTVALVLSGNVAPIPWDYEYIYPANGIQIRQLLPATISDPNDPLPTNYIVANATVGSTPVRVIQTDVVNAQALITNQPPESAWDSDFTWAVAEFLASVLAMWIEGRPDTARAMTEQFGAFEAGAMQRQN